MRTALLHPTYWPEVTRGAERMVHDLATTLAERDNAVTILTGHPGRRTVAMEDGVTVVRSRRPPQPPTLGLHESFLGIVPGVIWRLARGGYDVAHAFHLADAWAAVKARRVGGPPVVFTYVGIPTRHHLVARRYRLEMMLEVAREATCSVLSEAAADPFRRYLLRDPRVAPAGVLAEALQGQIEPPAGDTLLFPASIGDPRKRGELMLSAFGALRTRRPEARLEVARTRDPFLSPLRFELPEGARWIEPRGAPDLRQAYARAAATVLPSVEEPFGLVLLEALAAGRPVVAARSGACPEIVTDDRIGRLFEPDDEDDLVRAIEETLELASDPATAARCRERAAEFEWSRLAPAYEAAYADAIERG